jgi:hypothetical protein
METSLIADELSLGTPRPQIMPTELGFTLVLCAALRTASSCPPSARTAPSPRLASVSVSS